MSDYLGLYLFGAFTLATLALYIFGAVMSYRAWRRNGWPEARLAFYVCVATPIVTLALNIAWPVMTWALNQFSDSNIAIEVSRGFSLAGLFLNIVVMGLLAFSMYRLARRSARQTAPPAPRLADEIRVSLS